MTRLFILLLFVTATYILPGQIAAQVPYLGGIGKGSAVSTGNVNLLITDSLYNGASGDGFVVSTANVSLVIGDSLYNGGNGNGFTTRIQSSLSLLIADSLYNGGIGNGFNQKIQTGINLIISDSLYNGGPGKGEENVYQPSVDLSLSCSSNVIYWNGSTSVLWGNANNWDCGAVPGVTSIVIIPSGKPRYPSLLSSAEVKAIYLQTGTTLTLANGAYLLINGQ